MTDDAECNGAGVLPQRFLRSAMAILLIAFPVGFLDAAVKATVDELQLVSPVSIGKEARVGTPCPSFSWTTVVGALGYEIVVYEVSDPERGREPSAEPVIRRSVPAGATSWTPSLDECLKSPGRYGWVAGAPSGTGSVQWSRPALFRVELSAGASTQGPPREPSVSGSPLDLTTASTRSAQGGSGLRAATGEVYTPPTCTAGGEMFADVPATDPFCRWVEQLARDGVTQGCSPGEYCPDHAVTRRQMAMYLERAMRGTTTWVPAQGVNTLAPPADNDLTTVDDPGNIVGQYPSITIGVDGLPIISYYDFTAGTLRVMHCNDVACVGQDEQISIVDDPQFNNVGAFSSITIGSDGLPVISYYDSTADALRVAHCDDIACAGQNENISTVDANPASNLGLYTSITISRSGFPVISYQDAMLGALKLAFCNDLLCNGQNETIVTVDDAGDVGGFTSIAIGQDGWPIISYHDADAAALKVAHCDDETIFSFCGARTVTTVDDPGNNVGEYTSITVGTDGLPIVSYYDSSADALKVAHCNDIKCAGQNESITTLTLAGGSHTSIAIGVDGLPIISYHQNGREVAMAHCNDVACTGQDEAMIDFPFSDTGLDTSVTIGADGLPIVAVYASQADALKTLHCGNALCKPYFRRR